MTTLCTGQRATYADRHSSDTEGAQRLETDRTDKIETAVDLKKMADSAVKPDLAEVDVLRKGNGTNDGGVALIRPATAIEMAVATLETVETLAATTAVVVVASSVAVATTTRATATAPDRVQYIATLLYTDHLLHWSTAKQFDRFKK